MARRSSTVGSPNAKVTSDQDEALRAVAEGLPVVLIGGDPIGLGELLRRAPDGEERQRLLGIIVGDPSSSSTEAAAAEMAAELWPWVGAERPSGPDGPPPSGPASG